MELKQYKFILTGEDYHKKKPKFHALLKKYQFRWKGSYNWYSIGQTVTARFDRPNNVTIKAEITWMGISETLFLDKLKEVFEGV